MKARIAGGEIFYESLGRGRALFVVHGGPGIDHTCFRPWLDPLGEVARVVYLDLLGNGRSDRVALAGGMAFWVDGIDELRAALGIEKIVLFGHSFGGMLGQEYAVRHPQRLEGLILCATGPGLADSEVIFEKAKARATPAQLEDVVAALSEPAKDAEAMRASTRSLLPLYFHRYDPAIGEKMTRETIYCPEATAFGLGECLDAWTPRPGDIRAPTLVLSGADDWVTPVEHGGAVLGAAIPGAKHVVFAKSGHFPFIEEQRAFLDAVRAFLAAL